MEHRLKVLKNVRIAMVWKHEDVRSVRNRVAEVGLEYFCPDYVSRNGVSVTECNNQDI